MRTKAKPSFTFDFQTGYLKLLSVVLMAFLLSLMPSSGSAFLVYQDEDWSIQWDNTLKYSAAMRVSNQDHELIADPISDDGNRNFDTGLVSNRFDIFSEVDIRFRKCGFRASAAGWYDTVYNTDNDNDFPFTFNGLGANDEFAADTERLHGRKLELLDAFFFARGNLGNFPVVFRAGRHTLLWGETLFFAGNGVAAAQAPQDAIKLLSVPGTQAKELFMPVGQVSGQVQLSPTLSVAAFMQFEWRRTRLPAAGSYFSNVDILDAGGERLLLAPNPGPAFFRGPDLGAGGKTSEFGEDNWNQWGISASIYVSKLDADFGFYYLHYNAKTPQIYIDPTKINPPIGKFGEYLLVFPKDIHMLAASFGTQVGTVNVSGEVSWRIDTPLVSAPQIIFPGTTADNDDHPLYAIGDTFHANLSASIILKAGRLWDGGTVLAEIGYDYLLDTTENKAALDPTRDSSAWGLRVVFEPTYYQVLPGWDFVVPIAIGYNPAGKSSVDAAFNGGSHEGGDVSVGVKVTYLDVWRCGVNYTNYFGDASDNTLIDRDFVSLTFERTF